MSNLFGDSWFLLNDTVSLRWMLTLLHFLWQGAVIGVAVVSVARLLRHRSASVRYGLYLSALLSLPCCVTSTFFVINVPVRMKTAAAVPPAMLAGAVPAETVVLPESPVMIPPMIALPEVPQGNVPASPIMATAPPISMREDEAPAEPGWLRLLALFAPWITICYALGAFGFLLRLSIALWGGHRLRASASRLTDSRLLELIATEARQVGLRFVPVVTYCERVAVPTVVGILRPVVLLPASIITGLTSEEFAAIISHEFAHIRRYDLWVNLLQRVIESLLFFHPVVWFLSRRLSAERELCCDDLVVQSGCAPMNYAGALLRMAELCAASRPTNAAALAADGDEPSLLERRIQRLMNTDKAPRLQLTRAGLLALILTLVSSLATPGLIRSWTGADEPEKAISDHESGGTESVPIQRPSDPSPEINASVAPKLGSLNFSGEDGKTAKTDSVEIKYPHGIVNVEDLKTRSLADAVAAFNRQAQESPIGVFQQPITEKETLDAIVMSLNDAHLTDAFKAVLRGIAEMKQLPPNVYFRRFTRLDDERQMQEVWWVRLVVESEAGRVYSVPVRTTAMKSRPFTQKERQQNASGLTLINRFVSYFAEPPNILLAKEFPKDAVDRLVNSAETSIKARNTETFQSLFDWNGVSDETRAFVNSEFAMLADSTIHSVKVTPRNFRGELVHWSAYQHYQPNLEIVGYLDIEYSNTRRAAGRQPSVSPETTPTDLTDEKKESGSDEKERTETGETDGTRRTNAQPLARTLSLEIGQVGNELRLANYVPKGERELPEGEFLSMSIRGHIEPLADGTFLETVIITNPGPLVSGHVANEEVRQRVLNQSSSNANADQKVAPNPVVVQTAAQKAVDPPAAAKDNVGPKVTVRRRIVNAVDGSPIAGARVSIEQIDREHAGGEEGSAGHTWNVTQFKQIPETELTSDADGDIDYETSTAIPTRTQVIVTFNVSHERYVPIRSMILLSFLRDRNPLPESLRTIKLWPSQEVNGTVLNPDGSPAANIPIHGSTLLEAEAAAPNNRTQSVYDLSTDNQGNFRLPVASPGTGLFWFDAEQFAPLGIVVSSTKPNLGILHLESGTRIKGIIRDANGAPVAGIKITAERQSPVVDSKVMDFLKKDKRSVPGVYRRESESDPDGQFVLPPVHAGKYELAVSDRVSRVENDVTVLTPASHSGVFFRRTLEVTNDPQEIVLKAVPSVDVQFKTVDSKGHPADGIEFSVFSRISDSPSLSFMAMAKYKTPGIAVVRVPAELNKPQINIRGYSADGGCAFVIRPALKQIFGVTPIPSVPMYQANFATVGDIANIQVTQFKATTLDVNVVDEQNQPVADPAPKIEIASPDESFGGSTMTFRKDPDGHWRCTKLIPNVALAVSVEAEGLQSDKQVVTLKEGEERQITIQMKNAQSLPKDQK